MFEQEIHFKPMMKRAKSLRPNQDDEQEVHFVKSEFNDDLMKPRGRSRAITIVSGKRES